ncbi:hypothetical protein CQ018_17440 [Arthrobacter sp. MYb227]|nr:hypothetical protein CQ018_17440 [Arthrobacter sp. MYb227]
MLVLIIMTIFLFGSALFSKVGNVLNKVVIISVVYRIVIFADHSALLSVMVNLVGIISIIFAIFRTNREIRLPPWPLLAFLIVPIFASIGSSTSVGQMLDRGLESAFLIALSIAVASSDNVIRRFARKPAVWLLFFLFILSANELLLDGQALWPRYDGVTYRLEAVNHLIDVIRVRAMASTGYSITLGIVAGILLIIVCTEWTRARIFSILLALCAGLFVVFAAGSRTATIGLLIVLLFWVLKMRGWKRIVLAPIVATGAIAFVAPRGISSLNALGIDENTANSESFAHRAGVLKSVSGLMQRDIGNVLFGGGDGAARTAFTSGLVAGVEGITVFDNQYLRTLAVSGIIGLVLLIITIISLLVRGNKYQKSLIIFFAISMTTYDIFTWTSIYVLFVLVAASNYSGKLNRAQISPKVEIRP